MKEAFELIHDKLDELAEEARNFEPNTLVVSLGKMGSFMYEVEAEYGNSWIPIKKSLPKEDGWYLVYTKPDKGYKSINKAQFIKNYDYHWRGAGGIWRNVAYWMPLPESPI